jgi:hypothetical protein
MQSISACQNSFLHEVTRRYANDIQNSDAEDAATIQRDKNIDVPLKDEQQAMCAMYDDDECA